MKVRRLAFFSVLTIVSMISSTSLNAQNEQDITSFLGAGEDASKLVQAYTEPIVKSMSYGIVGGWFHTAKPHKTLGFDIGVSVSLANIPTVDNYFDPNKIGLSSNFLGFDNTTRGNQNQSPTIIGPKDASTYTFGGDVDGDGDNETVSFDGPEGFNFKKEIGFAAVPVPMAQVGIGIVKNTDLKIRLVPKQTVGSTEVQMFGVGVMHDIKQHIKGIKLLPFDLSALVAYNSVSGSADMRNPNFEDPFSPASDDGEMDFKFNSWLIQALVSKKISVLTGYAGVGYVIVNSNVDIKGTYEVAASPANFFLTNPVSIDFKNSSVRFTAGMRLKFGPFYLNGDYTLQKYNTLTVGLGFAFR